MALTKVLITVKTYPTLSSKYDELVCTAGFLEDGSWIRIYPVPYRKLDYEYRYKKWQWIELDLVKNTADFRPESYRLYDVDSEIRMLDTVGTENKWRRRKDIVLRNVYTSLGDLISEAKGEKQKSLAVFKPSKIIDFIYEPVKREWDSDKLKQIAANSAQGSLFDAEACKRVFNVAQKLPYKFSYVFETEDGLRSTLMVEDWELGELYLKMMKKYNDEKIACGKVKEKFFDELALKKDLYFFLGTTKKFHNVGPNPFLIIGVFYPPKEEPITQLSIGF